MTQIVTIKMTARQFLELGEDPAGVRLELVDGEVAVSPSPSLDHQYTIFELAMALKKYVKKHDLGLLAGDVDTILGKYDVRRPDLFYFTKARLHLLEGQTIEVPPDLCVEVISPSSVTLDRKYKFNQYRRAGIKYYWIVDPVRKTIEGYKPEARKYVLTGKASGKEAIALPPFEKPGQCCRISDAWTWSLETWVMNSG